MTSHNLQTFFHRHFIVFDTHFLLPLTIVFMCAIAMHTYTIHYSNLVVFTGLSLLAALTAQNAHIKKLFALCFVFALGSYHAHFFLAHHTAFMQAAQGKRGSLYGAITDIQHVNSTKFKYKIIVRSRKFETNNKIHNLNNHYLQIYTNNATGLMVADEIAINNIYIPGTIDTAFLHYLYKEGISASTFTNTLQFTIIHRPTYSLTKAIHSIRQALFEKAAHLGSTFSTVSTLFWGNRVSEEKPIKENFKQWGISHYLARSGLHLIIVIIILQFLLSMALLPYRAKQCILIVCVILYSIFTWASISFVRAVCMFLLYKLALLSDKPTHYLHLVTVVSLAVLLANPFYLFFLDFQLSFGLTFSLAWFNQISYVKNFDS